MFNKVMSGEDVESCCLTRNEARATTDKMIRQGEKFFAGLADYSKTSRYRNVLREPGEIDIIDIGNSISDVKIMASLSAKNCLTKSAKEEWGLIKRRCAQLIEMLYNAEELVNSDETVYFIELDRRGNGVLRSKHVHVGGLLRRELWDDKPSLLISATMTDGKDFQFIRSETGIDGGVEIILESPFDFLRQALLAVPNIPEPNNLAYTDHLCRLVNYVVNEIGGRTLALFTSYSKMKAVKETLACSDYRILCQGDAPNSQLAKDFREDPNSVLLGTESFWTGIDIPGKSLSCVIIDRLPFTVPTDPVLIAMDKKLDGNSFMGFSVPAAVIQLRQGVGRLIRRSTDFGVVVLADRRLMTKRYGGIFLSSLPKMNFTQDATHIKLFMEERRAKQ